MTQTDIPPDDAILHALSYLADARVIDVAHHFGTTTQAAGEIIARAGNLYDTLEKL